MNAPYTALYTGKIAGNTYSLRIWPEGNHIETDLWVAAPGGEVIHSMTRTFSNNFGEWSLAGIKLSVLRETREDLK